MYASCQTVYINPRPTREILKFFYENSESYRFWNQCIFPASENARREKIFRPRVEKIKQICNHYKIKKGTLLDVGAGFGTFCEEVKKLYAFKKIIAVEPTPELASTCRARGLNVIESPIELVRAKDVHADVITFFEVIEHSFSPRDFISSCDPFLKKGGLMIGTCPNVEGFDLLVLQEISDNFDFGHLNYFSPTSLSNRRFKFPAHARG